MGMVGGQVFDIQAENKDIDLPTLQNIHKHKTGMLIRAAVRMGAIAAGAHRSPTGRPDRLCRGYRIGLSDRGRCAERDRAHAKNLARIPTPTRNVARKPTRRSTASRGPRKLADDCVTRAIARLSSFGPAADPLRELARYITVAEKIT